MLRALGCVQFVLGPGIEITRLVTLVELLGWIAPGAVNHAAALHGRGVYMFDLTIAGNSGIVTVE